ncbi:MAG TPA: HAD family hydrolase, partial [Hellea balneolensis]|nr:HAD family hydrolase [Hellea balneolensis]
MHDSILKNTSICFDLDGTLVDTAPDLLRVLNVVIARDGLAPVSSESIRALIGFGALAMIKKAYANAGRELGDSHALAQLKLFLELYAAELYRKSRTYPGVFEVLRGLKQAGSSLSVCTNKPGAMARPLLEQMGPDDLGAFRHRHLGKKVGFLPPDQH